MTEQFDLIVVDSRSGGASLDRRRAPTGKRVRVLEHGAYLPHRGNRVRDRDGEGHLDLVSIRGRR